MACFYPPTDSADALLRPAHGLSHKDFLQEWDPDDIAEPHLLCAEMSRLAYAKQEGTPGPLRRSHCALLVSDRSEPASDYPVGT